MQRFRTSSVACAAVLTAAFALPTAAQISPSATQQMGNAYRQQMMLNAIRQTNINQTPHPGRTDAHKTNPISKQRMAELLRELTPEYDRRVREYGRENANQWLAAKARELGRNDAQASSGGGN